MAMDPHAMTAINAGSPFLQPLRRPQTSRQRRPFTARRPRHRRSDDVSRPRSQHSDEAPASAPLSVDSLNGSVRSGVSTNGYSANGAAHASRYQLLASNGALPDALASGLNGAAPSPVGLPSEQEGAAAAAPLDGVKLVGTYDGGDGDAESMSELDARIKAGVYSDIGSTKDRITRPLRWALAKDPIGPGRAFGAWLARLARRWRADAAERMPEARGDIREIVGQPVFVPLFKLFLAYGPIFRLSFGPKSFVVISDNDMAKQVLLTNAANYSKGILSEILDFVMGKGMIPADGEVWKTRRRAIVPALHRRYIASMVAMFGDCMAHGARTLEDAARAGRSVEMENFFSRLTLDIIGKAVFDYEFDSLTHDDPVIEAVYTVLREAELRSTAPIPYWNVPLLAAIDPRQRRVAAALAAVNETLDGLIARCQRLVEEEDEEFEEEFVGTVDPSILHFLLASGDRISSKQLRDDLMTMLIAGHETTAAVLTWTVYCLSQHPHHVRRLQREVDTVLGDRQPTMEEVQALRFTTRVLNESMRLYPQPPVLIRRALADDTVGGYKVEEGSDLFISVWNLHRSPALWDRPNEFVPDRFPVDKPTPTEVTHSFAYLPFGGGRRKCIGDQFALFEAVVALAMLVRRYEFRLDPAAPPVGMTTGATIHTSAGLRMFLTPRQHDQPAGDEAIDAAESGTSDEAVELVHA